MSFKKLTIEDVLTTSGKYPERAKLATPDVKANAAILVSRINRALEDINYNGSTEGSSGFRPEAVNSKTPGAAKKSLHERAMAFDFLTQAVGKAFREHPKGAEILRRNGLFMEALEFTPRWTHIDTGIRSDRPSREFKP